MVFAVGVAEDDGGDGSAWLPFIDVDWRRVADFAIASDVVEEGCPLW